jgi:hypothetical protein
MRLDNDPVPMKEGDRKRLVGAVIEIDCSICKLKYTPDTSDTSLNGNFYYKNCKQCRQHRLELKKKSISKRLS